jgi:hypothetical protein
MEKILVCGDVCGELASLATKISGGESVFESPLASELVLVEGDARMDSVKSLNLWWNAGSAKRRRAITSELARLRVAAPLVGFVSTAAGNFSKAVKQRVTSTGLLSQCARDLAKLDNNTRHYAVQLTILLLCKRSGA